MCGGLACPRFLGVYSREEVISSRGTIYKDFEIVRFLCREKGKKDPSHKTFSLLPYELIPYGKYSIEFVFDAIKALYAAGKSQKEVLDYINEISGGKLCVEQSILPVFKNLLIESIDKLLTSRKYIELESFLNQRSPELRIKQLLNYIKDRYESPIRGPCELGYEFYERNGTYKSNSPFLFGTPSQYRF